MRDNQTKVIAIIGPTGSGKTYLGIQLAKDFNGEIISVDSKAVYRKLDIGTAKPTREEQAEIPHHLIDVVDVGERFTVVNFQVQAKEKIVDTHSRGKVPFLVGGTGLYLDSLINDYTFPPEGDMELRYHLERETDEKLRESLRILDVQSYKSIDTQNRRRVIRALEVALGTGKGIKKLQKHGKCEFEYLIIGLDPTREELNLRIDERFDKWIEDGLLEEVKWVMEEAPRDWVYSLGLHYRYLSECLEGKISKKEAFEKSKKSLHDYAKRQMTWFKRNKEIRWVNTAEEARNR